ncbi:hypothetical protein BJ165DRAFT_1436541 [Panaeolus papilionaceus]|nr:hypothetical protein BJ165DRAFT_1436541 [Panaeolus papilionaceus]
MQSVRLQRPAHVRPMSSKESITPRDYVVLLFGGTGTGKSSFIEKLASNPLGISERTSTGVTRKLTMYELIHPTTRQRVVLVDTPGTADLHLSENNVVKQVAKWVKSQTKSWSTSINSSHQVRPAFLESITVPRLSRTKAVGGNIFKDLAGNDAALCSTVLTTAWDTLLLDQESTMRRAEDRHDEYRSRIWKDFIAQGAVFEKYENTFESASHLLEIITRPLHSDAPILMTLHKEVLYRDNHMKDTSLGRILENSLVERITNLEQADAALRQDLANKDTKKNVELREALSKEHHDIKKDLHTMRKEKKVLDKASRREGGCLHRLHFSVVTKSSSKGTSNQ